MSTPDFSSLLNSLPAVVARKQVPALLGGLISEGYLQNLDSEGKGPRKIKFGRRVGYTREDLIAWLEARSTVAA